MTDDIKLSAQHRVKLSATDVWVISQSELFNNEHVRAQIPSTPHGILSMGADKDTIWVMLRAMAGASPEPPVASNERKREAKDFDNVEVPEMTKKKKKGSICREQGRTAMATMPTAGDSAASASNLSLVTSSVAYLPPISNLESSRLAYASSILATLSETSKLPDGIDSLPLKEEELANDARDRYHSAKEKAIAHFIAYQKAAPLISDDKTVKYPEKLIDSRCPKLTAEYPEKQAYSRNRRTRLKPPPANSRRSQKGNIFFPPRSQAAQVPSVLAALLPNCQVKTVKPKLWQQEGRPQQGYNDIMLEEIDIPTETNMAQLKDALS